MQQALTGEAVKRTRCSPDIYATAFPKASELEAYLNMIEEAKKRDHRKLGKELELFAIMDEGPGFPFFLPKGMALKNTLDVITGVRYTPVERLCGDFHSA